MVLLQYDLDRRLTIHKKSGSNVNGPERMTWAPGSELFGTIPILEVSVDLSKTGLNIRIILSWIQTPKLFSKTTLGTGNRKIGFEKRNGIFLDGGALEKVWILGSLDL